jgi:DNA-binding NtrC family response regulator
MLDETFRADLYFRLSAVTLVVPPLEGADTELLARSLLAELCEDHAMSLPDSRIAEISSLAATCVWPGGARELRNALQRFLLLCDVCSNVADTWHLAVRAPHRERLNRVPSCHEMPIANTLSEDPSSVVERFDDLVFLSLAEQTHDVRELAFRLKRSLPTVYERLRRLGIKPRDLGRTPMVTSAKEKARTDLAQHQPWIQSILKDFHKI